jgi:chain length determinant protein EpsF
MTLSKFLQVLWARRKLFIGVLFSVVALVLALCLVLPRTYTAQVSLVADLKGVDPVTGSMLPAQLMPSFISTQMDIIASHNVALKVVDKYKLVDIPDVRAQFQQATRGEGSIRDWVAENLLHKLDVRPSRESNVFTIRFAAPEPDSAALLANAFADAYIQTSIELKLDPAKRQAAWFDEQLIGLRKRLEQAQQRLSEFQKTNSMVSSDERLDVEMARLAAVSSELVGAQAAATDARTRQAQMNEAFAKNRLAELPDILANGLLQSMKADLTRAEGKLSEVAERFGRNHPQYISAAAEVKTLNARFAAELQTAKGSINQAAAIAAQRFTETQRALDEQKKRILALKQTSDGRDVLIRDVESAKSTYEGATQRASAVRLESQLDQSSVAVLNPAIRPIDPSSPRVALYLVLATVMGTLLAAGCAVAAELRDRRVRSSSDLTDVAGVPVLAELMKPPRRRIQSARASRRARARIVRIQSA